MTAPASGDTTQERIARLEESQAQLAREVGDLAGSVDRFVSTTQSGFERLSNSIAQVERNVGQEISRITRPDYSRLGVWVAIVVAVLSAALSPVLVRMSAQEFWTRAIDERTWRDHEEIIRLRIDAAVLSDRAGRGGDK